jgi:D-tyrosyl-tRNA(Tyr) deacylase
MRCVIQRVASARVLVEGRVVGESPGVGLLVLCGLEETDTRDDLAWTADKLPTLRIFPDDAGKMNRSVLDVGGTIVLVPNFTLAGDAARGRRPSFDKAMKPERAEAEFAAFVAMVGAAAPRVATGVFRAHMRVELVNDGPVTILLDSRSRP